jgi:hypothetical protein
MLKMVKPDSLIAVSIKGIEQQYVWYGYPICTRLPNDELDEPP